MATLYASLWFANFDNCSAIYGFEIDDETFDKAIYNINLNPHISNKIKAFNFGLSDSEEMVDLYYLEGCDGINTTISEFTNIQMELKTNKDNLKSKKVKVMKSSDVLSDIINKHKNKTKIILKIDTEGSEYKILNDLLDSNLLNFVDVILGEEHIFSDESVYEMLIGVGFNQIILEDHDFTYNFAFVNDKSYDVWPLKE